MELATWIQIQDDADRVSFNPNTLGETISLSVIPPAIG